MVFIAVCAGVRGWFGVGAAAPVAEGWLAVTGRAGRQRVGCCCEAVVVPVVVRLAAAGLLAGSGR